MRKLVFHALPIIVGVLALWLLEASRAATEAPVRDLASAAPTRVIVFWIDALADVEVEQARLLPNVLARIEREGALHGPARACADAVSVPCFTAMITGVDRFSVFALGKNFGARAGALDGSVLRALQQRHKRIGYIGVPMFEHVLSGLEYVSIARNAADVPVVLSAPDVLEREKLDFLIVHLHETDDIAHRLGPSSEAYQRGVRAIDRAIEQTWSRFAPTDHVVIMGDHGHTDDGRHFAGLDVPTYTAVFGPLTRGRTLRMPMALSDYGAIWGRLFGIAFGPRSWVDDYFDRKQVAVATTLPELPAGAPPPLWAALLSVCLGLAVAYTPLTCRLLRDEPRMFALSTLAMLAMLALGTSWTALRPWVSFLPLWESLLIVAALTLLSGGLTRLVRGRAEPGFLFAYCFLGTMLLALPTIYKYGGTYAILSLLVVTLLRLVIRAFRERKVHYALGLLTLFVPFYTFYNPAVRNFSVRWFPVYAEWLPSFAPLACVGWTLLTLAMKPDDERTHWPVARAGLLGLGAAQLAGKVPALLFAFPCAVALPLCLLAMRRPKLVPWAVGCAIPALWFFAERDAVALAPLAAVFVLWASLPRAVGAEPALLRALVLLALVAATFWASMGCRLTGVTFNFFFAWLPQDVPVTRTWAPHALYTFSKYALAPALGILLARHTAGPAVFAVTMLVDAIARAKLALVLAFFCAFSFTSPQAGPFLTADIVQEAVLWLVIVGVWSAVPKLVASRRVATTELGAPEVGMAA
jgi:hypothetical protein